MTATAELSPTGRALGTHPSFSVPVCITDGATTQWTGVLCRRRLTDLTQSGDAHAG